MYMNNLRTNTGLWAKEGGNVLFNDAFNTFYSWLYGVGHMMKNLSDSEKGNLLGLLLPISSKGSSHR